MKESLGADRASQQHATQMLQQASQRSPDINNYLCYILVHPEPLPHLTTEEYHVIRCSAAILLKNNISNSISLSPQTLAYIKSELLSGLEDENKNIRHFTGNVITELMRKGGVMLWSDMLDQLLKMVENPASPDVLVAVQEGAMNALKKVCQDSKKSLARDSSKPLNFLIPKFLQFTHHPSAIIQAEALEVINIFLPMPSEAILAQIDNLVESLFRLGNNAYTPLRKEVCRALVHLVDVRPDKIAPIMSGIVDYLVEQQSDDDHELALDAAEFWLTAGEHEHLKVHLGSFLPKIVPVLLKSMVYSQDDIERLGGEGDDADEEDKIEDIKPTFAKSRQRLHNGENVEVVDEEGKLRNGDGELSEGEIEEEDSEFEDFFGSEDPEDRWNLRKCSAAALDVLATVFHQPVLEVILPYLKENLRHPEWPFREAAVLALGAVADGCLEGVSLHLPELVPYLISLLSDPEPLVRQITCWTLGRYSRWAASGGGSHQPDPLHLQKYFEPTMEGILLRMLDGNKRVQEAAASAFANLEEQSKDVLVPYIKIIVQQFVTAMRQYKDRNMFILYDCVQTLAEHVNTALARDDVVEILMPALIERWKKVKNDSKELFPLLECLSYVSTSLGRKFEPFSTPIFHRCINIIHLNLELQMAYDTKSILDKPDKDFLVTSLDLLSALIQALDGHSSQLVSESRPNFFQLLIHCMADANNDVRQSSYALLGDCAIYVFVQLQPYLPSIMDLLIQQLNIKNVLVSDETNAFSVINNACWSCGEIALQQGSGMSPYVEKLYGSLLDIIQSSEVPASVTENAAVALGRLGLGSCIELAPHLETFASHFLDALDKVDETDEKDTALKGFCMIVGRHPEAMESCLVKFFKAIARYKLPSPELKELFRQTIVGYHAFIADFDAFLLQIPQTDREVLQKNYGN